MVQSLDEVLKPPLLCIGNPHLAKMATDFFSCKNYEGLDSILAVLYATEPKPLLNYHRWKEQALAASLREEITGIEQLFTTEDLLTIQKLNLMSEKLKLETVLKHFESGKRELIASKSNNLSLLCSFGNQSIDAAKSIHYYVLSCIQTGRRWKNDKDDHDLQPSLTKNRISEGMDANPVMDLSRLKLRPDCIADSKKQPSTKNRGAESNRKDALPLVNITGYVFQVPMTSEKKDVTPTEHKNIGCVDFDEGKRKQCEQTEKIKLPFERGQQGVAGLATSYSYSDCSSATQTPCASKSGQDRDLASEPTHLAFRINHLSVYKWVVGKGCAHIKEKERKFDVRIDIESAGDSLHVKGRREDVYYCMVDIWRNISEGYNKELQFVLFKTDLVPTLEDVIQHIVNHEVFIDKVAIGLRLCSFDVHALKGVLDFLEKLDRKVKTKTKPDKMSTTTGRSMDSDCNISAGSSQSLNRSLDNGLSGTDRMQGDYIMKIANSGIRSWLIGRDGSHLRTLERRFDLSISFNPKSNRFHFFGPKQEVLRCVYEIWKRFTLPHHIGKRFDDILERPFDRNLQEALRSWRDVDVAEFILAYSVYVCFERNVVIALDRMDMERALRAIDSGEYIGSSEAESLPKEFSVQFELSNSNAVAYIYGPKRSRLNDIEREYGVCVTLDSENWMTVSGDQKQVFSSVLYFFTLLKRKMISKPLPRRLRFRDWTPGERVRIIANYSVYIDSIDQAIYAFDQERLEVAMNELHGEMRDV